MSDETAQAIWELRDLTFYSWDDQGAVMTISEDGRVSFGDHLTPEEGAAETWRILMETVRRHNDRVAALEAENARLRVEIEAAKRFGGGFYGEIVDDGTRAWYLRDAQDRLATLASDKGGA